MDSYGDFVVVWSGDGRRRRRRGIFAQVYDKTGKAVGDAFLVNQTLPNIQKMPTVAMDANGDFVVTWTGYDPAQRRASTSMPAASASKARP